MRSSLGPRPTLSPDLGRSIEETRWTVLSRSKSTSTRQLPGPWAGRPLRSTRLAWTRRRPSEATMARVPKGLPGRRGEPDDSRCHSSRADSSRSGTWSGERGFLLVKQMRSAPWPRLADPRPRQPAPTFSRRPAAHRAAWASLAGPEACRQLRSTLVPLDRWCPRQRAVYAMARQGRARGTDRCRSNQLRARRASGRL